MAMTLKSEPVKIGSGHNDNIYVIDSDNKTSTNYKYILDVYINGVRIARLKNNPNPNFSNYGIFNVTKIVQSYLNSDYFTAAEVLDYIQPYVIYNVKFSERYEALGAEVTNDDVIVSSSRYVYNTSFNYVESTIFEEGAAVASNLLHRKFITNRLEPISVPSLRDFFIQGHTIFSDIIISSFALKLTTYTGLNHTGTASLTTFPAIINRQNDFIANFGTQGLSNAGVSLTGIESYKIELYQDGIILQDTIYFNIDLCEPKYEILHFVFMNHLGGFESVYFTKASRKRIEVDRKIMQGQGTKFNETTFKVDKKDSNGTFYEAQKVFGARYVEKLKVNSNWLNDQEYVWLTDLITSPVIYLEETIPANIGVTASTVYIPVRLTNNEYEIKKKVNEKLTQIELEFDLGFNNYSQIR